MYSFNLGVGRRLGIVALAVAMTGAAWDQRAALAGNVLVNPGFEDDAVLNQEPVPIANGWSLDNRGDKNTVSSPTAPVHSGIGALQLARSVDDTAAFGVPLARQFFPAVAGQAFDLQAWVRVDPAFTGATRTLIKITFTDFDNPVDLQPASVTFGVADGDANFPGIISNPQATSTTPAGEWVLHHIGGVAPPETEQVSFFAIFVDATAGTVYYDDFKAFLVGDFDGDFDVDKDDLPVWQTAFGQTADGDADGDGDSDGADYLLWQSHQTVPTGATAAAGGVPEPATATLALVGLTLAAARGRGRRR